MDRGRCATHGAICAMAAASARATNPPSGAPNSVVACFPSAIASVRECTRDTSVESTYSAASASPPSGAARCATIADLSSAPRARSSGVSRGCGDAPDSARRGSVAYREASRDARPTRGNAADDARRRVMRALFLHEIDGGDAGGARGGGGDAGFARGGCGGGGGGVRRAIRLRRLRLRRDVRRDGQNAHELEHVVQFHVVRVLGPVHLDDARGGNREVRVVRRVSRARTERKIQRRVVAVVHDERRRAALGEREGGGGGYAEVGALGGGGGGGGDGRRGYRRRGAIGFARLERKFFGIHVDVEVHVAGALVGAGGLHVLGRGARGRPRRRRRGGGPTRSRRGGARSTGRVAPRSCGRTVLRGRPPGRGPRCTWSCAIVRPRSRRGTRRRNTPDCTCPAPCIGSARARRGGRCPRPRR